MKNMKKGFTLIELMIVVAIIGILAAIAIPKFADLINKSKEGATKGSLSSIRSAIQVYYGDNEGWFPADDLASLTANAKYLSEVPQAKLPGTGHPDVATVHVTTTAIAAHTGGWAYYNDTASAATWGNFHVSCTHEDIKGRDTAGAQPGNVWSTF
jgi:prepilin-type N-terminal cleavage/methylation domain-containing protein